ncbi:hypothetical protein [Sphingomonas melonis]|uniref:hypothetical protein n=1 Tax=Sphingomonas melonis TaxID=152682 RepID=UPI0035C79F37
MMSIVKLGWSKLRAEAAFIVLFAVAAAGAYLYVQYQRVSADRDDAIHRAEVICAKVGADWSAVPSSKTSKAVPRGATCARRAADLAAFKASADEQTARLLADTMKDANLRAAHDAQLASTSAARMRDALTRMENADAQAERRNLVDAEWTAAVNHVAGLRPAAR